MKDNMTKRARVLRLRLERNRVMLKPRLCLLIPGHQVFRYTMAIRDYCGYSSYVYYRYFFAHLAMEKVYLDEFPLIKIANDIGWFNRILIENFTSSTATAISKL
jgi:hypothetical protein